MLNLTLLAFTITSSFNKSPFLHFSSANYPSFSIFKTINVQKSFSSFLITQSFNSFSIIEGSTFNQFITSLPILSFKSNQFETKINDQTFYGDTIPSSSNKFYHTNYTEIINCKFMSITDDENEQLDSEGGLCIYTTKSTTIDGCYFFAIMSLRSGSAILFAEKDDHINATVVNCMFKSISQSIYLLNNNYFTGTISYGSFEMTDDEEEEVCHYISSSLTNNCYFEKIHLIGYIFTAAQFGIVSYFSHYIVSKNLNFSSCDHIGYSQQTGFVTFYWGDYSENYFSFINFLDCKYREYGCFTIYFNNDIMNQEFSLSFANFINNSGLNDEYNAQLILCDTYSNITFVKLSNIQCNSEDPFLMYYYIYSEEYFTSIDITVSNSLFGCSFDLFSIEVEDDVTLNITFDNNIFDYTDFNIEITNNIISNFGYKLR